MLVNKVLEVDLTIPSSVKEKFVKKRWSLHLYLISQFNKNQFNINFHIKKLKFLVDGPILIDLLESLQYSLNKKCLLQQSQTYNFLNLSTFYKLNQNIIQIILQQIQMKSCHIFIILFINKNGKMHLILQNKFHSLVSEILNYGINYRKPSTLNSIQNFNLTKNSILISFKMLWSLLMSFDMNWTQETKIFINGLLMLSTIDKFRMSWD